MTIVDTCLCCMFTKPTIQPIQGDDDGLAFYMHLGAVSLLYIKSCIVLHISAFFLSAKRNVDL